MLLESTKRMKQRARGWLLSHPVLSGGPADSGLPRWRERILFSIMATGLVLGALTFVPVANYALSENRWLLLLLDLAAYAAGLYVFFSSHLSYGIRSACAVWLCYGIGLYVILLVGFFSGGPAWLFGFAVLSGCLRGVRSAVAALLVNAATLAGVGTLFAYGWLDGARHLPGSIEITVTAGFNFMLLNTISAVSVAVLVRGLESTTEKERSAVRTLEDERKRLIRIQEDLRREVADRIDTERALRRSERRYRGLVETSPDIIFQLDFAGTLLFASPAFGEILGYRREGRKRLRAGRLVHPDDRQAVAEALERIKMHGSVRNLECRLATAHGRYVWLSTNAAATIGEKGKGRVIFGVAKEITERKEAEARLKTARLELEQQVQKRTAALREANERLQRQMEERFRLQDRLIRSERLAATGQLAASVAHEINSPLQGVSALLNVMSRNHGLGPELRENLDLIKGAFERIRDTVRNLLDLNRPGNETKRPLDLNKVVENTVALTRNFMKKHSIEVSLSLSAGLPTILGSPQQLGQLLINLINNAVEAICPDQDPGRTALQSPLFGGKIRIATEARGDSVYLRVEDNGPGIPEGELENIFDPFYTRKKSMGMGVGLSICHGVVEDHDGTIRAKNGKDGGAVFTVALPARG